MLPSTSPLMSCWMKVSIGKSRSSGVDAAHARIRSASRKMRALRNLRSVAEEGVIALPQRCTARAATRIAIL
jgi:hypothetical protein